MKKELEGLWNYFSDAAQLLYVMGRGAKEQANNQNMEFLKSYHHDVANALEYVAGTLNKLSDDFCFLIEKMPEDEDCAVVISEEEEKVSKMYRNLKDLITNKNELEKSAYDTYNVCAMIGCLIRAIHDQTNDSIDTEEEKFFWQLKGSLQMAYNTLDNSVYTFFEVTNKIDALIPFIEKVYATSQEEISDDLREKKQ